MLGSAPHDRAGLDRRRPLHGGHDRHERLSGPRPGGRGGLLRGRAQAALVGRGHLDHGHPDLGQQLFGDPGLCGAQGVRGPHLAAVRAGRAPGHDRDHGSADPLLPEAGAGLGLRVSRAALRARGALPDQRRVPGQPRSGHGDRALRHRHRAHGDPGDPAVGHDPAHRGDDRRLRHDRRDDGGRLLGRRPARSAPGRAAAPCRLRDQRGRRAGCGAGRGARGAPRRRRLGPRDQRRQPGALLGLSLRRLLPLRLLLRHRPEPGAARALGADARGHQALAGAQRPGPLPTHPALPAVGTGRLCPLLPGARTAGGPGRDQRRPRRQERQRPSCRT